MNYAASSARPLTEDLNSNAQSLQAVPQPGRHLRADQDGPQYARITKEELLGVIDDRRDAVERRHIICGQ